MKHITILISFFILTYVAWAQSDTTQKIIEGRRNSAEQQEKPYVILISGDGFRYDYADKYHAQNLLAFAKQGVRAASMIPSYPSLTFPNHYSIATGLYPSHHGLVSNYFYDPARGESYSMRSSKTVTDGSWYGGIPLWVLAEQQQMLTASFYWVGSEADIKGTLPTYYYKFNEDIPMDRRIEIVVDWLKLPADRRPHLITFYISDVDHAGHSFGPNNPKTAEAVRTLDADLKKLSDAVATTGLPVNFIFVSDHGMTQIDTVHSLPLPAAVDTNKFVIPRSAELVALYAKNKSDIAPVYAKLKASAKNFNVYLRTTMPARLHYNQKDDSMHRIGDILLVPVWPRVFSFWGGRKPPPGAHGFDPWKIKDMHASFFAWGPNFKKNILVQSFENVNVYPIVTKILGLSYTHTIDGKPEIANKILRR